LLLGKYAWEKGGIHTGFWWESEKERDKQKGKWEDNIKVDLREIGWGDMD
jgi:hypothetical protein